MATPPSKTKDGFERQFGVNHLAHWLLTTQLLPTLISSSTPEHNSRVVNVSSSAHAIHSVRFDDPNWLEPDAYDPFKSYGQSKTANIWTANYIDRVYGPQGVHALSLHPGGIWTGLQAFTSPEVMEHWSKTPGLDKIMKSAEQGAGTSIWAAVGKVWEGKGGEYLVDCSVAPPASSSGLRNALDSAAAPWVHDQESEDRLWELSAKLLNVSK